MQFANIRFDGSLDLKAEVFFQYLELNVIHMCVRKCFGLHP